MLKTFHLLAMLLLCSALLPAQTTEELTQEKLQKEAELADKSAQLAALTAEVDGLKAVVAELTDKITPYPRWGFGLNGNIGFNFSNFTDWFSKAESSTNSVTIGYTLKSFANLDQRKYFWRNNATITMGWNKFDDKNRTDDEDQFRVAADALNAQSLFGYKLIDHLAVSALGDYRTAMLDGRFNNPGFLDLGVGITWTPIKDLVVVVHPLNYNFVFSNDGFDYQSSMGTKVVADYQRDILKNLHWNSNLAAFISYDGDPLHNWTWTNGLSTSVKGFGIGFDFALRQNKQEALAVDAIRTDNPLQTYYILGLTYAIKS